MKFKNVFYAWTKTRIVTDGGNFILFKICPERKLKKNKKMSEKLSSV